MAKDPELAKTIADRIDEARQAESNEDLDTAIELYEENIKSGYPEPYSFDRLMILYRKQKRFKDELRVIKRAIKVFTDDYARHQKNQLAEARNKKQVKELSAAIMRKSGLTDRKGKETYLPEPIGKWTKRKGVVEKKLK
jgi:tetratricopeptide (TPR) repeat protein